MSWLESLRNRLSPPPAERDPELQAAVAVELRKLALYYFPSCAFCVRVQRAAARLGLDLELRNIHGERAWRDELAAGGGSTQVPCLRIVQDDGSVTWLYESADIVRYLEERFAPADAPAS